MKLKAQVLNAGSTIKSQVNASEKHKKMIGFDYLSLNFDIMTFSNATVVHKTTIQYFNLIEVGRYLIQVESKVKKDFDLIF